MKSDFSSQKPTDSTLTNHLNMNINRELQYLTIFSTNDTIVFLLKTKRHGSS